MKKRIWEALVIVICTIGIIACNPQETVKTNLQGPESKESKTEEIRVETGTTAVYEATLEELAQLLEMTDSETATLLGGGEENWTENKSFYIGRIYEIQLYDGIFPVYTCCDDDKKVNAVSVWLENGDREISKEDVEPWVNRLTEFTGAEAIYDEISSEAGTKQWKWVSEDRIVSLMWTGQLLSLYMNLAIGELY